MSAGEEVTGDWLWTRKDRGSNPLGIQFSGTSGCPVDSRGALESEEDTNWITVEIVSLGSNNPMNRQECVFNEQRPIRLCHRLCNLPESFTKDST